MRFGHLTAEFQGGDGLLSRDRGEAVEELVESVARFKVIVKRLHRYACPHKDWRSAENLWVTLNDVCSVQHDWILGVKYTRRRIRTLVALRGPADCGSRGLSYPPSGTGDSIG
jgi:hypothetical protein